MPESEDSRRPTLRVVVAAGRQHDHAGDCVARLVAACEGIEAECVLAGDTRMLTPDPAGVSAEDEPLPPADLTRGWNDGARDAVAPWLLFLTADLLAGADAVGALLDFASEHAALDAVSPHTLDARGVDRPIGRAFASAERVRTVLRQLAPNGSGLSRARLPVLADECLLVRTEAFRALEGFEPRFGPRAALLDIALRLLARGGRVGHQPASLFLHAGTAAGAASEGADVLALRRRWGVHLGSSPDALWVDGREPFGEADGAGRPGHFCDDPARVPPPHVSVGHGTYFVSDARFLTWTAEERIRIGRYSSFARGVTLFAGGGHATDTVSTFPFESRLFGASQPTRANRSTRDTEVGNDVWVGDGAVIGGGVHVGDGAVVATGAVVLSDVPPYAIVAGNPARVLRYRFSRALVESLLRIRWWEWDEATVRERLEWFYRPLPEFTARFDPGEVERGRAARAA